MLFRSRSFAFHWQSISLYLLSMPTPARSSPNSLSEPQPLLPNMISIWTPQILQSFNQGSSNITIGLLAAVPQICTILGMIYWSRHSDRRQERRHHTALPYLFAAAGWLLASATDHNMIQMLGIIMASTGSFSAMAIFWTTPDQSISLRARAIGIAVINATGNIGSALSPFMIGWLKDLTGSFNSGLWFVAALLVIGAGIIWAIPMQSSRPRATP